MNYYGAKENTTLSVLEVNRYVKLLMENDALLTGVAVRGEISNLKYHTSGHLYFTLKDEDAEISAVMFRSSVASMRFTAKNGMRVNAYGRISVYEKSGKYQLYVSAMTDDGVGRLQLEYERLLNKLRTEGLFDESRKKKIPKIPECIGIITSPTGAAVRDMINVTGRRWSGAKILLYPSLVQGADAPESLCRGLEYLNAEGSADVIIIGRGGGSIEDLWAFNDERVVRAIAASEIPVISAVGHETDFTLSDFVADLRAPTPSAAAELAVPDKDEMRMRVDELLMRSQSAFERSMAARKRALVEAANKIELCSPTNRLKNDTDKLKHITSLIEQRFSQKMSFCRQRLQSTLGRLEALDPIAVLVRGYSISTDGEGKVISSVKELTVGDNIKIRLSDGEATASVTEIKKIRKNGGKKRGALSQ